MMIADEHLAGADAFRIAARKRLDVVHVLLAAEAAQCAHRLWDILACHAGDRCEGRDRPSLDRCFSFQQQVAVPNARARFLQILRLEKLPSHRVDAALPLALAVVRQQSRKPRLVMLLSPTVERGL